jgi:hypothetical protein
MAFEKSTESAKTADCQLRLFVTRSGNAVQWSAISAFIIILLKHAYLATILYTCLRITLHHMKQSLAEYAQLSSIEVFPIVANQISL